MTTKEQAPGTAEGAPPTPAPDESRRTSWHWIRTIGLALVMLLVGIGVGLLLGRSGTEQEAVTGIAPDSMSAAVAAWISAANRGDAAEIAALYSPDATHVELDREPAITTGTADTIGGQLSWYHSLGGEVQATGPAVAFGSMIAQPMQWGGGERGIQVFEIDERGLISRQWVLAPTTTPNWR